mmetsp:Transcript_36229/g.66553  ORF Transcript_36229/g.66553 Transcript_36229/m.66553 type:complete len:279 (+) Transcript_36229:180-1016(+)
MHSILRQVWTVAKVAFWSVLVVLGIASTAIAIQSFSGYTLTDTHSSRKHDNCTQSNHNQSDSCNCTTDRLALIQPGKHIVRPLPNPVVVLGMPKTGTSTIASFFRGAGYNTSHWVCGKKGYCGKCMPDAVSLGHPPLTSCGEYDVWAQMDLTLPDKGLCHMPQVQYLQDIHDEAPMATFIMNTRNVTRWIKSMRGWSSLDKRFVKCSKATGLNASDDLSLERYIVDHVRMVRDFVNRNPTHALVEVDIEDPNAGCIMSSLFKTDSKFWTHHNQKKPKG